MQNTNNSILHSNVQPFNPNLPQNSTYLAQNTNSNLPVDSKLNLHSTVRESTPIRQSNLIQPQITPTNSYIPSNSQYNANQSYRTSYDNTLVPLTHNSNVSYQPKKHLKQSFKPVVQYVPVME